MNKKRRREIFMRLRAANPEPTTELDYASTFQLLIAVILSAQATDVSVNKATRGLFAKAADARQMQALGELKIRQQIQAIGLFNTKARNVYATCGMLLERHQGEVPEDRAALEALPGVGRKTASVILNTAFGKPAIAVDTHIFRVSNRTGMAPGKTVLEVEKRLLRQVEEEFKKHAHHWLILHGRYQCMARRPACPDCLISDLCDYRHKTPTLPATPEPTRD